MNKKSDPGWKKEKGIIVPDYEKLIDVERVEFAVKIKGFRPGA